MPGAENINTGIDPKQEKLRFAADVSIYDRDELDEAFESGELSDEQYNAALKECDKVIKERCSDIAKSIKIFGKVLALVNVKIRSGEEQFKRAE